MSSAVNRLSSLAFAGSAAALAVSAQALVGSWTGPGASTPVEAQAATAAPPVAVSNDNRRPAGELKNGILTLRLEVVMTRWQPEGESGATRTVQAFAEEGQTPLIPGPLVRVPEGSDIHITVRNRLAVPFRLHGMITRPGDATAAVAVAPGALHEFRFKSGRAGTYFYWAETSGEPLSNRRVVDSQLTGAFVVDPPRAEDRPDDRIFVITEWLEAPVAGSKFSAAINGRSWPHTDRLTLPFGKPVEWRVINGSFGAHPMHLHGTFYTVESRGDAGRDAIYGADGRRLVTTELMESGTTMTMRWVPDRVGNWLFHCHILAHVSGDMRLADLTPAQREHAPAHEEHEIDKAMAGLVIGITVPPGDETAAPDLDTGAPRRISIEMMQRPGQYRYGAYDGFGFRIVDPAAPLESTTAEAVLDPPATSPTLVLTRGQPVIIDLVSQLKAGTQIHWHGMELESYNDGVPGWSGALRQITPLVAPGATYQVRFTPPRAGTFIYHTHAHDARQLSGGLYGALIVLEPGRTFDPATDRVVLLGGGPAIEVNRSTNPAPIDLKVGVKYRFRLINITTNFTTVVSIRGEGALQQWRAVAKDGADLPPSQTTRRPAQQVISVGETYDFEFEPAAAGELRLEVVRRGAAAFVTSTVVRVSR